MLEELVQLPGVGPKVAACVALFSCDQHSAIPVDTHVWALACKYYTPQLRGKTLTAKMHPMIMQVRTPAPLACAVRMLSACCAAQTATPSRLQRRETAAP